MFDNQNDFSKHIEQSAVDNNMSYVDALLLYCEEKLLEPDDISSFINKSLRDKLEIDFIELNYMSKRAGLDI